MAAVARLEHLDPVTYRRRLIFLVVAYFLTPWATVGFHLLAGTVLLQKGVQVQDSLLYVGVAQFGPLVGILIAALAVDAVPRKWSLVAAAAAMMVIGLAFAAASGPFWMMATGLAFTLTDAILVPILVLYAAELFPTQQRASATAWAWTSSRAASALVPLVLLPFLRWAGPVPMFAIAGVFLALFLVVVWVWGPMGKSGRAVDEPAAPAA